MKNSKCNEMDINISVIGLSGGERDKGVKGVGKSCLCNRLAQPNNYKNKHSSVVSSIDFYGSEMNNSQWLYWGCVEHDIRGRRCQFRFVEQTIMVDDISHCAVLKKEDYAKRATSTELQGTKHPHIVGPTQTNSKPLTGKISIQLFILIYDVSNVEGREPSVQDSMFKQLFDSAMLTKRPVIIVSTKHDQASPLLVSRLNTILEKRPYNRFPLIEISANLAINIDQIYDLSMLLCDSSTKTLKTKFYSFQEAFSAYETRLEQCRQELNHVALSIMDSDMWHATWAELRRLPKVESWITRLGADLVEATFDNVRLDVRLKRRVVNQQKHKECLIKLLSRSHHLLPSTHTDIELVLDALRKDDPFMKNFINFDRDAEYFDFLTSNDTLPKYILEPSNENNLVFVVKEYVDQMIIENQLLQRLITDCPGNFRKTRKEIGDNLKHSMKYFIPDKIISNVHERFLQHYYKILEGQFLETLHQYPNLFLTQGIFKSLDIISGIPQKMNGISRHRVSTGSHNDSPSFLTTMTKEINAKIEFTPLSVSDDETHIREQWITNYLQFLYSSNDMDCIYSGVTHCSCNIALMSDAISDIGLTIVDDHCHAHVWYLVIVGKGPMRKQLVELIQSIQNSYTLELCKVHSSKYEIKYLESVDQLKDVITELSDRGEKCCSLCALICADDAHLQSTDIDRISTLERHSTFKVAKYIVHSVVEELIKITAFDECSLYEDVPDTDLVHISTLLTDSKKLVEPSIIWVVTVCGDLYDYDGLLAVLVNVLKLHSIPKRMNSKLVTISGCFTSKEIDRRNYRLCFTSYHQAMKNLILSESPPPIDGLLLVSSVDRLASLNTCLGIRKYLPVEIKSQSHSMLLGLLGHSNNSSADIQIKAKKYAMHTTFITHDSLKNSIKDPEAENQILDFFINVFQGSPVTESLEDISTNTSSLKSRSETRTEGSLKVTNQYVCKTCGQCRSYENINNNLRLSESTHDSIFDTTTYEQIPGEQNAELFGNVHPEFKFNETQDPCTNCTLVNCSYHQSIESSTDRPQIFRTRMRSQSGPDLRNSFDSNKSSLNQSNSSTTYCSSCGAKISSINDVTDSRKLVYHKLSVDKDSPSKKFTTLFQDIFSNSKKLNESQSNETRKSFNRASSKRRK